MNVLVHNKMWKWVSSDCTIYQQYTFTELLMCDLCITKVSVLEHCDDRRVTKAWKWIWEFLGNRREACSRGIMKGMPNMCGKCQRELTRINFIKKKKKASITQSKNTVGSQGAAKHSSIHPSRVCTLYWSHRNCFVVGDCSEQKGLINKSPF